MASAPLHQRERKEGRRGRRSYEAMDAIITIAQLSRVQELMLVITPGLAILLGVGCESHDAMHALYKRRFSQALRCPVTSHSVPLLLRKAIKPTIDLALQFLMINLVVSSAY